MLKSEIGGRLLYLTEYRKALGLKSEDILNVLKIGDIILLVPRKLEGDTLASKMEESMKEKGITLKDLLKDLKE